MTDLASLITAIAALTAAGGGILAAILAYRARRGVQENQAAITLIEGKVHEVGKAIDGRLTELLKSSTALARAEGIASGEQNQRDRSAAPERTVVERIAAVLDDTSDQVDDIHDATVKKP